MTRRAADARRPGGGPRPRPAARSAEPSRRPARPALPLLGARSTRRLAVLGAIFVVLGIMLVPTFRAFLGQRDDYAALTQQVDHQRRTVQELQHQLDQWKDPAFIEAQARVRLTFVYPGETAYQVIDLDRIAPAVRQPPPGAPRPGTELTPYYATLLDSLRAIDQGPDASPAATDHSNVPLAPELLPKPSAPPSTGTRTGTGTGTAGRSGTTSRSPTSPASNRSGTPSGSATGTPSGSP